MAFEQTKQGNLIVFKDSVYEEIYNQDHIKQIFEDVKKIEAGSFKEFRWVLIEFGQTKVIHPNTLPLLCRISSHLEQFNVKFAVIADQKICDIIIKNAVDRMVSPYLSLDNFNKTHGFASKDSVKLFLNTLLESVIMSMKVLIETDVKKTKVEVIKDAVNIPTFQAGAMAGIISAHFSGNIVIGFSAEVFKRVMAVFLQMEIEDITPEIKDGAAE